MQATSNHVNSEVTTLVSTARDKCMAILHKLDACRRREIKWKCIILIVCISSASLTVLNLSHSPTKCKRFDLVQQFDNGDLRNHVFRELESNEAEPDEVVKRIYEKISKIESSVATKLGVTSEVALLFKPLYEELSQYASSAYGGVNKTAADHNPIDSLEIGLRDAYTQMKEMWYYIESRMKKETDEESKLVESMRWRKNTALVEVELMQDRGKEARNAELKSIARSIQEKINQLQNPEDCQSANKLLCDLNTRCGFGCQLHHIAICFTIAIGTKRTLVLDSSGWTYTEKGWHSVFKQLTNPKCNVNLQDAISWNEFQGKDKHDSIKVVHVKDFKWAVTPAFLPLKIPQQYKDRLVVLHGDPAAWWMGQLVSYIIRPQPWLQDIILNYEKEINFKHPIAGIHVRRTDKIGTEAAFHDLQEYMAHVIDWFDKESLKRQRTGESPIENRPVYIATDDSKVLGEARNRYPGYHFLGDQSISNGAQVNSRYSLKGIEDLMKEVTILSKCDFFVGTFSSGMSRLVYEMMQFYHGDASSKAHSLDDLYYYIEQHVHQQLALYDHVASSPNEINMKAGDVISTRGNHWDGFSFGTNDRTKETGLYPSHKVQEIITGTNFKIFSNETSPNKKR